MWFLLKNIFKLNPIQIFILKSILITRKVYSRILSFILLFRNIGIKKGVFSNLSILFV